MGASDGHGALAAALPDGRQEGSARVLEAKAGSWVATSCLKMILFSENLLSTHRM